MKLAGKVVNANNRSMYEEGVSKAILVRSVEKHLAACSISAVEAWHTLVGEGCEPITLMGGISCCIKPNPELNSTLANSAGEFRRHQKRVKRLAEKMRIVAKEYWALKQEPILGTVITDVNHVGPSLEVLLDLQAECLDVNTADYLKRKSRHFLTEDVPLVALSAYVVGTTKQRHYSELATLLEAWSDLSGKRQDFFPDNLSKKVRRFVQKFGKAAFKRLQRTKTSL